jgi:DDE superfamily endonuclease
MDQTVIANIKKNYKTLLYRQLILDNSRSLDFNLKKLNVLDAIELIIRSWTKISTKNIVSSWDKLCPEPDFINYEALDSEDEGVNPEENLNSTLNDILENHDDGLLAYINEEEVEDCDEHFPTATYSIEQIMASFFNQNVDDEFDGEETLNDDYDGLAFEGETEIENVNISEDQISLEEAQVGSQTLSKFFTQHGQSEFAENLIRTFSSFLNL